MDKRFIVDIKNNDNNNDFTLNISSIGDIKTLNLDINSCLINYRKELDNGSLDKAYKLLEVIKRLSSYKDKRFSDANILYKLHEIILLYENISKENIIGYMDILLKIKSFFNFLISQSTFQYNDENTLLIDKIKDIKDSITLNDLSVNDLYKNKVISILDFEIVLKFKKEFVDDREYYNMKEIYDFFENKMYNQIKKAILEKNIEYYKAILKNKYDENYFESEEFENLVNKITVTNYKNLVYAFDNNYLLYKFNIVCSNREKESILIEILLNNFINIPKIYRLLIIENIIKSKKIYIDIENLFSDITKDLENITKENRLNAIII